MTTVERLSYFRIISGGDSVAFRKKLPNFLTSTDFDSHQLLPNMKNASHSPPPTPPNKFLNCLFLISNTKRLSNTHTHRSIQALGGCRQTDEAWLTHQQTPTTDITPITLPSPLLIPTTSVNHNNNLPSPPQGERASRGVCSVYTQPPNTPHLRKQPSSSNTRF